MTERTPPGRASLARVTINCTARRNKSRIVKAGYHGHSSAQDCAYTAPHAMIGEFAPHKHGNRDAKPTSASPESEKWLKERSANLEGQRPREGTVPCGALFLFYG
jgi:hypothetical protein